jgi:hypothetical protein
VVYNIEATDTGRGGFAEGSDKDYMEREGVSPRAVAVGSDLRKLTAREMLGVFIQSRARHFQDIEQPARAARDYALAHALFPNNRQAYIGLVGNLLTVGERLFAANEFGHPASLAAYLPYRYRMKPDTALSARSPYHVDPLDEIERINALNRADMERLTRPPTMPQPYQPPAPGLPQPYQPPTPGVPEPYPPR